MSLIKKIMMVIMFVVMASAWSQSSPVEMLENSANNIISTLKENKSHLKQNHQIIHQAVQRYLLPNVDVTGMARSVLGRQAWMKASIAEQKEFTRVFTALVIRTYASPLAEYTGETVKFMPVRGALDSRFIRVSSVIIRPNGQKIPLNYSLVSKQGHWKIYDLSVEGVSLLQSFRSQFGEILQNASMQELIAQMRKNSIRKAA